MGALLTFETILEQYAASPSAEPQAQSDAPPRRWSRRKRVLFLVLAAVIGYCAYQPAQTMGELRGRPFEVYKLQRNTEIVVNPGTRPPRTESLVVGFWSDTSDLDQILEDSRQVAPALLDMAQRLGLRALVLLPSDPVAFRRFPLGIKSYAVRFTRDSLGGYWVEEFRTGDAARAVAGPPIAMDDSLARTMIRRLCDRDVTGIGLIVPSARGAFADWRDVASRLSPTATSCNGRTELISVAAGKPTNGTARRLAYRVFSAVDTSLLTLWLEDESSVRYVSTVMAYGR